MATPCELQALGVDTDICKRACVRLLPNFNVYVCVCVCLCLVPVIASPVVPRKNRR